MARHAQEKIQSFSRSVPKMTIREIRADEAPFTLLLLADPSPERIRNYLRTGTIFIGEESGIAVVAAVIEKRNVEIEIMNIAVAQARQRHGLGRQMLGYILKYARETGANRLTVGTGNSSLGPLAFYQRNGFQITEVVMGFFNADQPPVIENGILCRDMIRLSCVVHNSNHSCG